MTGSSSRATPPTEQEAILETNFLGAAGILRVVTVKPGFVDTQMIAGMELPGMLTLSPETVAEKTYRAWKWGRDVTYITWYWWAIITLVRIIPEAIFKKIKI